MLKYAFYAYFRYIIQTIGKLFKENVKICKIFVIDFHVWSFTLLVEVLMQISFIDQNFSWWLLFGKENNFRIWIANRPQKTCLKVYKVLCDENPARRTKISYDTDWNGCNFFIELLIETLVECLWVIWFCDI